MKSLQTQLELSYATTASSGAPVAGSISSSRNTGGSRLYYPIPSNTATHLGGSVAVPGSTTLTAILETKDARIQTLQKEVDLLEAELQRIRDCGGRLRDQLLKATAVPSTGIYSSSAPAAIESCINRVHSLSLPTALESLQSAVLTRGPVSSINPLMLTTSTIGITTTTPTKTTTSTAPSTSQACLTALSSGLSTGVVNPYTDRHQTTSASSFTHQHHQHQPYLYQQQQQQTMQQHLKQIEPAAAGALALHAHNFNKHDLNFKRQVSFFINNVRIEKNDSV